MARKMTPQLVTRRFGDMSDALAQQIGAADADSCQSLFGRAIVAASPAGVTQD